MLSQKRLMELVSYDELTGTFTKISIGKKKPVSNSLDSKGYKRMAVDGVRYKQHRLVWLYAYGYFPSGFIDHINRDRSDNRLSNLRIVDPTDNPQNCGCYSSNKLKTPGVRKIKNDTYEARITTNKKTSSLGFFSSAREAGEAYLSAKALSHPFYYPQNARGS